MAQTDKRSKVAKLTLLGMLTAILIVLGYVNIPMPAGLSITFNMIPVAVAAIAMGIPGGLGIGTVFGLISFLQCFNICGTSPLGITLLAQSRDMFVQAGHSTVTAGLLAGGLMFLQRVVSRTMVGLMAGLIWKGLKKTRVPLYFKGLITGFAAAFFNTLFFMSTLVLIFSGTPQMASSLAGRGFFAYLAASVGVNAIVEMGVSAAVTGAVAVALKKARLV